MRRLAIVLALFLAAATAAAESADLRVHLETSGGVRNEPVHAGSNFIANTFPLNRGPDVARNVVVRMKIEGFPEAKLPCPDGVCPIGDVPYLHHGVVPQIRASLPVRDFAFRITVTVSSDTPDPNPSNNSASVLIVVSTAPRLSVFVFAPSPIDPGRPFVTTLSVRNYGFAGSDAHDVVTTLDLPEGVTVETLPERCSFFGPRVTCREERIAPSTSYQPVNYRITLRAPARYEGGELQLTASVTARERNFGGLPATYTATTAMLRTFFVTTTADDGPGSLRTAMHDVNAHCQSLPPCTIRFAIAEPSPNPWQTIRVQSPLPALRGRQLYIDGATQRELTGDPAFKGKPVEISGGGTVAANALELDFGYASVSNLAINGFGEYAIRLAGGDVCVRDNFLGTDPTGSIAVPNRRGIHVTRSTCQFPFPSIENNVISGNLRAGIFVVGGCYTIASNRIGVRAFDDAPLPNGASGIYLDTGSNRSEVTKNVIAFNGEMGIAVHPGARFSALLENRVWGNGTQAIDVGLDGPTPSVVTEQATVRTPAIVSAVYDAARRKTIVRFTGDWQVIVHLYASDGPGMPLSGDIQRPLGGTIGVSPLNVQTYEVDGDLRGQWITATSSRWIYHGAADIYPLYRTSEVSAAVQVQ